MFRTLVVALALIGLSAVVTARSAEAHAAFITSDPAPDSILEALPGQVRIVFSEPISQRSTILVLAPDGTTVSGETIVAGNVATTTLRATDAGVYVVTWSNVSLDDGHESSGSFQFTVVGGWEEEQSCACFVGR